jgi:hypothetical protein
VEHLTSPADDDAFYCSCRNKTWPTAVYPSYEYSPEAPDARPHTTGPEEHTILVAQQGRSPGARSHAGEVHADVGVPEEHAMLTRVALIAGVSEEHALLVSRQGRVTSARSHAGVQQEHTLRGRARVQEKGGRTLQIQMTWRHPLTEVYDLCQTHQTIAQTHF